MQTIRIKGLTKYTKERIKQHGRGEHGDTFVLKQRGQFRGSSAILVESIDKSWRIAPGVADTWSGWLLLSDIEEISNDKTE